MAHRPSEEDARVAAFFDGQPAPLRGLMAATRRLLDDGLPKASCAIKWNVPVWTGRRNIASVMPHPDRVNLQFFQGALLPDPQRLLDGSGTAMRHVKLHSARDLKDPSVKALVRAAWRADQA